MLLPKENTNVGPGASFKAELTPAKVLGNVSAGIIGTALIWLFTQLYQTIPLREYLWPQGVVIFLTLIAALFIIDSVRLRRRLGRREEVKATPLPHYYAREPSDVLGRYEEIDEVIEFVMSDERKFLCLHGPGGVGKTTVAQAALDRLKHLRVAFVEVDAIKERDREPRAVDQAFAVAVATHGLRMGLVSQESPVDAVTNALKLIETRTVLVIDNVEQMASRAAPIIHRWVQQNPLVRIIVTSRVELNVGTEKVLEIDVFKSHPSDLDAATMLSDPELALQLFARRRNDRDRGFKLTADNVAIVNRICNAVGGLPLGIELAASVERSLNEIEDGIKKSSAYLATSRPDLPERQRSLAATIDWSLSLLESETYALALQLSVARGDLDDEAINDIVRIPGARRIDELLSALVAANLLVRRERDGRSTYREPIEVRLRCAELRLVSPREADRGAWSRFAATFMARAEAAYNQRYGNGVREALDALERDYDNLFVIAQRAEPTDPIVAARTVICLAWLVRTRRPAEPQRETLTALTTIVPKEQHAVLSQLQRALAEACLDQWVRTGDNLREEASEWAKRAIETGKSSGEQIILGEAQYTLARVATRSNDTSSAATAFEEAARSFVTARQYSAAAAVYANWALLPRTGAKDKLLEARKLLGNSASPLAQYDVLLTEFSQWQQQSQPASTDMRTVTNQLTEIAEQINSIPLRTRSLHAAALLESELDDQDRAFDFLKKKAAIERKAGSTVALGMTMSDMAAVLLRRRPLTNENLDQAIELLNDALPLVEGRGLPRNVALLHGNRGWALFNRGRLRDALADSEKAIAHIKDLLDWDKLNAFIQGAVYAQICAALGDVSRADSWAATCRGLAEENGFNEESLSPEIKRHARWVREYLGASDRTTVASGEAAPEPVNTVDQATSVEAQAETGKSPER